MPGVDTQTRYQGVFARHQEGCRVEVKRPCNCTPTYFGTAWDRIGHRTKKTRRFRLVTEARSGRIDLQESLKKATPLRRSAHQGATAQNAKGGRVLRPPRLPGCAGERARHRGQHDHPWPGPVGGRGIATLATRRRADGLGLPSLDPVHDVHSLPSGQKATHHHRPGERNQAAGQRSQAPRPGGYASGVRSGDRGHLRDDPAERRKTKSRDLDEARRKTRCPSPRRIWQRSLPGDPGARLGARRPRSRGGEL